jgi:hypothetical protein
VLSTVSMPHPPAHLRHRDYLSFTTTASQHAEGLYLFGASMHVCLFGPHLLVAFIPSELSLLQRQRLEVKS